MKRFWSESLQAPRSGPLGRRGDPHAAAAGLFVYQEMAWLALVTRHKSLATAALPPMTHKVFRRAGQRSAAGSNKGQMQLKIPPLAGVKVSALNDLNGAVSIMQVLVIHQSARVAVRVDHLQET